VGGTGNTHTHTHTHTMPQLSKWSGQKGTAQHHTNPSSSPPAPKMRARIYASTRDVHAHQLKFYKYDLIRRQALQVWEVCWAGCLEADAKTVLKENFEGSLRGKGGEAFREGKGSEAGSCRPTPASQPWSWWVANAKYRLRPGIRFPAGKKGAKVGGSWLRALDVT